MPKPYGRGRKQAGSSRVHDPEKTMQRGMSTEGEEVDDSETMASTGDSEGAFQEIASGSATGLGIDRGEAVGTGGLAADEDLDEVAEGDSWRQNFRRRPYFAPGRSAEHFEPGERLGWVSGADLDRRDQGTKERGGTSEQETKEEDRTVVEAEALRKTSRRPKTSQSAKTRRGTTRRPKSSRRPKTSRRAKTRRGAKRAQTRKPAGRRRR